MQMKPTHFPVTQIALKMAVAPGIECSENETLVVQQIKRVGISSSAVPDVHDVAILHDVIFSFEAQRAASAGVGF